MCHCHHFCQITIKVNCLRDFESFDVVRVSGMTRTYEFNANMYIYIIYIHVATGMGYSIYPMSRVHVLQE